MKNVTVSFNVDYSETIAYLISLVNYHIANLKVDDDISEKKFPLKEEEKGHKCPVAFSLLRLPAGIYSETAIEEAIKQNWSPGTIRGFLNFAARCPELVKKYTIVIFGSILTAEIPADNAGVNLTREGFKSVPVFSRRGKDFWLDLLWLKAKWPRGCMFFVEDKNIPLSY